jgi:hypothetical protein
MVGCKEGIVGGMGNVVGIVLGGGSATFCSYVCVYLHETDRN